MRRQHRRTASVGHSPHPSHRRAFIETVGLERWHRRVVYATTAALVASGVLWLVLHNFVRIAGPFGEAHHPLEAWALRAHGLAAMLSLLVLGSLLLAHMRRAWVLRRNIASGFAIASVFAVLVASGYALYYFGTEDTRPIISAIHWVIGLGCAPLLTLHIVMGRRRAVAASTESTGERPQPLSIMAAPESHRTA